MGETWTKIKAWTKGILLGAVALYTIFFLYNNSGGRPVPFWYWFGHAPEHTMLAVAAVAFLTGAVFMLLLSTSIKTVIQLRRASTLRRQDKIERDIADMKMKAAMLQTQPAATATTGGMTVSVEQLGRREG